MNIIEAVKSGKRFKRLNDNNWSDTFSSIYGPSNYFFLSFEDVLADDWMIDEPKFLVTKSKLKEALIKYESLDDICKHLGIEE